MFPREEITDDWSEWEGQRLAWALEAHLLPYEEWSQHKPPQFLQDMLDRNEIECYPMGLGHHEQTGYFITMSAGQGPGICGIEKWGSPKKPEPVPEHDDDDGMIPF